MWHSNKNFSKQGSEELNRCTGAQHWKSHRWSDLEWLTEQTLLKETSSGVKGRLVRAVSCSVSWMYTLYPQPGEGTIHRLFLGSFLWHKSDGVKGILQLLSAATSSSPWRFTPRRWQRAAPPVRLWILWDTYFLLAEKQRVAARIVWIRQLGLLWRDVWIECRSFFIWVTLNRLRVFARWPVSTGILSYNFFINNSSLWGVTSVVQPRADKPAI